MLMLKESWKVCNVKGQIKYIFVRDTDIKEAVYNRFF